MKYMLWQQINEVVKLEDNDTYCVLHRKSLSKGRCWYIIGLHSPVKLSLRKDTCQNRILLMSWNHSQLLWLQETLLSSPNLKANSTWSIVHSWACLSSELLLKCLSWISQRLMSSRAEVTESATKASIHHLTFQKWSTNIRGEKRLLTPEGVRDGRSGSTDAIMMVTTSVRSVRDRVGI